MSTPSDQFRYPHSVRDCLHVAGAQDELAASQKLQERIKQTVDAMSQPTRDIFVLHRLVGLSFVEIATHVDIPISDIEEHVGRAAAALVNEGTPDEIVNDAAAWLAALHAPCRNSDIDRRFRSWIEESPGHAMAWELVTDAWEEASTLKKSAVSDARLVSERFVFTARHFWVAIVTATAIALIVAGVSLYHRASGSGGGNKTVAPTNSYSIST